MNRAEKLKENSSVNIAIIGMACRFPGARNYQEFWQNLVNDINNISEFPAERLNWRDYINESLDDSIKTNCKWGGFIEGMDQFDASFFNISPHEAQTMDPQQRLLLESTWACIEDAGYAPLSLANKNIGVYVGACNYDYKSLLDKHAQELSAHSMFGAGHSILANRLSYYFDFHGPSMLIDTACSSSLVAVHHAVQALLNGECDSVLVSGVNVLCDPSRSATFNKAGILSPSGQCHSFDKNADGYVRGEGVGVIFLKPLEDALKDNNSIYGIIKGSAINHGGKTRSISSPSPYLQAQVITKAWKQANVNPNQISYIEAHGTGTPLGDPIELIGLQKAFKQLSSHFGVRLSEHYCGLGTVKTNIGHLEAASGIAGLIKVLLAFKHGHLPKLQNFQETNPHLKLKNSPFYLMTETSVWQQRLQDSSDDICPRVAGISSFGIGGTNAHIVVEEPPSEPLGTVEKEKETYYLLSLSAKHPESLRQRICDLQNWLIVNPTIPLVSLAAALNLSREHFKYRNAFVVNSIQQLQNKLSKSHPPISLNDVQRDDKKNNEIIQHCYKIFKAATDLTELQFNLETLASMYVKGYSIEWNQLHPKQSTSFVKIPTYPFLKNRYWFNPDNHLAPHQALENKPQENKMLLQVIDQEIAILYLQDKTHKNQMSVEFLNELQEHLNVINRNSVIKVLIITGYDDVFCLGGDEKGLQAITNEDIKYTSMPAIYQGLLCCNIPVIAAMQGHAFGAGLTFGLCADIVILSQQHAYTANFMNYGITPGVGSTLILREKLSPSLATEMMWTGREYRGHELAARGAPVIVKPGNEVLSEAMHIAKSLMNKPLRALQVFKKSNARYLLQKLPSVIDDELGMHQEIFQSSEAREKIDNHFSKLQAWKTTTPPPENNHNKKILLKNLSAQYENKPEENRPDSLEKCLSLLQELLASQLHIPIDEIKPESEFSDLGIDSIVTLMLVDKINKTFLFQLSSSTLYDYRQVGELATFLAKELDKKTSSSGLASASPIPHGDPIGKIKLNDTDMTEIKKTTTQANFKIDNPNNSLFPTTTRQERWFRLAMKGMPLNEFNILERICWQDELNLTLLQRSLIALMKEQAVLRTAFIFENETLYQHINSSSDEFKIEIEDAQHIPPELRETHINARCEYYNSLVIPFTDYPLWKMVLVEFDKAHYEILILSSHIIMDVYSLALMAKQLFTFYVSLELGQEPKEPMLKISFADYVMEQQQLYKNTLYTPDLHYWQKKLSQPQKKLYLDNKLIADPSVKFKPATKTFVISTEQAKEIQSFASQRSCTDTSFFLTLLRVILSHYTHTQDIWIDVVDALRNANNRSIIGWTATTYPHMTELSENDSFVDLMVRVQNEFFLVKQHSQLPLSHLTYPDDKRFRDEVTAVQFNRIADMDLFYEQIHAIKKVEFPVIPNFFCYNFSCFVHEKTSKYHYGFLYNTEQFEEKLIQKMLYECQKIIDYVLSKNAITIRELLFHIKNELTA